MKSKIRKKIKPHYFPKKFSKQNKGACIADIEPKIGKKQTKIVSLEDNNKSINSLNLNDYIGINKANLRQNKLIYNNKLFKAINSILIIKLIILLNFIQILSNNKLNLIECNFSKITLKVKGIGTKIIFGNDATKKFPTDYFPSEIYINGDIQETVNYSYYFPEEENDVQLIWNDTINNTDNMFRQCSDIIEIDLSNFDSSLVTTMISMFKSCTSLTSINLTNFDTSQVTNINHMFDGCNSLTSLDLSFFNTSKVTFMNDMFLGCESLTSLNLSNFITEKTTRMSNMFKGCSNLEYINLKDFTEIVLNENYYQNMFDGVPENVVICIDESLTLNKIFPQINNKTCYIIDCSDNWKANQKKIINGTGQCIDYCENDTINYFEYNGKCYQDCTKEAFLEGGIGKCKCELQKCLICPPVALNKNLCTKCNEDDGYYPMENDNTNLGEYINCYNESEGYYLDTIDKIYRKCFHSCETCEKKGNNDTHNCIKCNGNFSVEIKFDNYSNCYKKCTFYYYFDENNIYQCTLNTSCPDDYPILIESMGECIKKIIEIQYKVDSTNNINETDFQYEFITTDNENTIQKIQEVLNDKNKIAFKDQAEESKYYDSILERIESNLISENYNTSKLDKGQDEIIKDEKIVVTLSTTKNQYNYSNSNLNITSIDLGQCETLIRSKYNLTDNNTIYIKKVEVAQEGMLIPKIEYEIYSKLSGNKLEKLNLSICSNTKMYLSIPATIPENLDILNSSSGYYNDICYTTTSKSGTDISLKDRKSEFINKTLCQDGCEFLEYNYDTKKANCTCDVQEKPFSFDDIKIDKEKLYENFIDIKNVANIEILVCYDNLLQKDGIVYNIGFYIISLIIIIHIICMFIFYIKQYDIIKNKINDIEFAIKNYHVIKSGEKERKKTNNIINIKESQTKKKKRNSKYNEINKKKTSNKIILGSIKNNKPNKKSKKQINNNYIIENNQSINININNKEKTIKKNKKTKKNKISSKQITFNDNPFSDSNMRLNSVLDQQKLIKKVKNIMEYKDNEKNALTYEQAIQCDKRTYCEYYISLLRTNHNLISSFCGSNDYNARIIKINLFFNGFTIGYIVNGLFFDDDTMHKIYVTNGSFNLEHQLAKIIYSSIISVGFNSIIKILALSNDAIIKFKNDKTLKDVNERKKALENKLKIKFIFYYIISEILLLFFWYYISIFGAVYINTQSHLLKDTLLSFVLSLIYPFGISLLPGMFRIPALSQPKEKRKYLYKFSKLLQKF